MTIFFPSTVIDRDDTTRHDRKMATCLFTSLLDTVWNPSPPEPLSKIISPVLLSPTLLTKATKRYRDLHEHLMNDEMDTVTKRRRLNSYICFAETKLQGSSRPLWLGPREDWAEAEKDSREWMLEEVAVASSTSSNETPTDLDGLFVSKLLHLSDKIYARRESNVVLELKDVLPGGKHCDKRFSKTFDYCFSKFLLMRHFFDQSMASSSNASDASVPMITDVRNRLLTSMLPMYLNPRIFNPRYEMDDCKRLTDIGKVDEKRVLAIQKKYPDVLRKVWLMSCERRYAWDEIGMKIMFDSQCCFMPTLSMGLFCTNIMILAYNIKEWKIPRLPMCGTKLNILP